MGEFIVSVIIIIVMLSKKLFFFSIEPQYSASILGKLELGSLIALFILGMFAFIKGARLYLQGRTGKRTSKKFDLLNLLLLVSVVFTIGMSLLINLNKTSLHWDAIALYDARAKFLEGGMKFSDMPTLSKYDNLNKYYYLLYPPYTSIGHFFWRNIGIFSQVPVGVYYSVTLVLLVAIVFFVAKESLGLRAALLLILVVASNYSIFNISIKEYTNLPYALYIVAGILLLFSYLKTRKLWLFLFGVFFVSSSIWIRLLEPMWIAVSLAFGIAVFSKRYLLRWSLPFAILLVLSILQYVSWAYFTKVIAGNPGFLNFSPMTIIEPFVAVFTGAPIVVITTVARAWGAPFFIHFLALAALLLRWRLVLQKREILFLGLVLFFSISLYFLEFYFLSFQVDWWSTIAKSLDRSSTFLIPVSGYLLIYLITSSKVLVRRG